MATSLDAHEQDQLDQIKDFWSRHGIWITSVLVAILGVAAAWNGWTYWQRTQAAQAAALYEELERAVQAQKTDRVQRVLAEMQAEFGRTTFSTQGSLLAAKVLFEAGKLEAARAALDWTLENAPDEASKAIARLRLAALDIQLKAFERALKRLDAPVPKSFESLVADRKGDVFMAQGQTDQARALYQAAWRAWPAQEPYRKLLEFKLAALGVPVSSLAQTPEGAAR